MANENNRFLTYRESAHALVDYVKDMGYTHIELMPIEEFPFDGSWGYQVVGYYAPTSRYGTPEDFMYFVDYCHQNNIGVILDWVPAHFPKDAHGLARFDGTALYEHADPRQGEHPDWGTLIFNFGRNEVKNFLIANAVYWIEKYHLDGLRVDAVASMLYLDYGKNYGQWIPNQYGGRENIEAVEFMKHLNSVITGLDLGIVMIAEESTAWEGVSKPVEENGLGYNYKWNMGWMNDFLNYMSLDPIYRQFHQGELTFSMDYAYTENFILVLSHDEVVHGKCSMINKMPGDLKQKFSNLRLAYGFMYAHPGKKLSFMGNEFGQFSEWSEERSLDWFLLEYEHHRQMKDYSRDLNLLYKSEKAMWEEDHLPSGFTWLDQLDGNRSFIAFSRQSKKDKLIFLLNFIPVTYERVLGVEDEGEYIEIFNSDSKKYGGSGMMNQVVLKTQNTPSNGRNVSLTVKLPALSIVVLRLLNQ
jgi:1,4-alpha-glucan branching enzyme